VTLLKAPDMGKKKNGRLLHSGGKKAEEDKKVSERGKHCRGPKVKFGIKNWKRETWER